MYTLPELDYDHDALEPFISKQVMELHHSKHHQAYVDGANSALSKIDALRGSEDRFGYKAVLRDLSFNLAGHQLHTIFWKNLAPKGTTDQHIEEVRALIEGSFSDLDSLKTEFNAVASSVEGSGWAILAMIDGKLLTYQAEKHNLLHPITSTPILVLDMWEHAYYLDHQNRRAEYLDAFWNVVNWKDMSDRLKDSL